MPVLARGPLRILFIHVPRTGGTTVEETLVRNGFEMSYRRGGRYGAFTAFDRQNKCSPQHMHAELLARHFRAGEFHYVFCTVRHPVARFQSEWAFRRRYFSGFPFETTDAWVDHLRVDYAANPFHCDNHLRPQHEFPWRDPEVFRLEDGLQSLFGAVSARIGHTIRYDEMRLLASGRSQSQTTAKTRQFVNDFYREDFERFGYAME